MTAPPWAGRLAVVGIGLEGMASLSPRGRRLLAGAQTVAGHSRHLDLIGSDGSANRVTWAGGLDHLPALFERQPTPAVLLASGDPNWFGIGATLAQRYGRAAVDLEPSVSSFQLALARAGVPLAGTALLSAHGRPLAKAAGMALGVRRAAFLTDAANHPGAIASALVAAGVEATARLIVAERLGGEAESLREGSAGHPPAPPYDALSIVILERPAGAGPGTGRDEAEYEHKAGLISKAEVRALALAALDVAREDIVWDLGAGSGSLAIEAGRLASEGSVYAVERRAERAAMVGRNLARHRSWNVEVIEGEARTVMARLPRPDAVFIGGGGPDLTELIRAAVASLRERRAGVPGRLVASLATLESSLEGAAACRALSLSWRLTQVQLARARDLGPRTGWEALNPVQILSARVDRR